MDLYFQIKSNNEVEMKKISKFTLFYFVLVTVLGFLYSAFLLPWQTPDELTHLRMISDDFNNPKIVETFSSEMKLYDGGYVLQKDQTISKDVIEKLEKTKSDYKLTDMLPRGFSIYQIRHLPGAFGILLGILLHLPIYWIMRLGECFAVLFYAIITSIALELLPIKKLAYALMMLTPMCLQQASSINYDSVLLPMCFLFCAMVIRYIEEKKDIVGVEYLKLLLILGIIVLVKLPYGLLALLLLAIPLNQYVIILPKKRVRLKNTWWNYSILVACVLVAFLGLIEIGQSNIYIQVLKACIKHPRQTLVLFTNTWNTWRDYLLTSTVGDFGYLDTPIPVWSAVVFLCVMGLISFVGINEKKAKSGVANTIWGKIVFIGVSLGLTSFISMSMINHTYRVWYYGSEFATVKVDYNQAIFQIPYIGGVQGRYYIPAIMVLLFVLPECINIKNKKVKILVSSIIMIFAVLFSVYCLNIIHHRYFG